MHLRDAMWRRQCSVVLDVRRERGGSAAGLCGLRCGVDWKDSAGTGRRRSWRLRRARQVQVLSPGFDVPFICLFSPASWPGWGRANCLLVSSQLRDASRRRLRNGIIEYLRA
jgi:hypothetical protein